MSEQEKINLYSRLKEAMQHSTMAMLERKLKLGERVVIADADGKPIEVSAEEAIRLYTKKLNY